jgi:hypothetical protein
VTFVPEHGISRLRENGRLVSDAFVSGHYIHPDGLAVEKPAEAQW